MTAQRATRHWREEASEAVSTDNRLLKLEVVQLWTVTLTFFTESGLVAACEPPALLQGGVQLPQGLAVLLSPQSSLTHRLHS